MRNKKIKIKIKISKQGPKRGGKQILILMGPIDPLGGR